MDNVCVCVCQWKTKDGADGMSEKCPFPYNASTGFEPSCTSGIHAHHASNYTTRTGTPRVSSNKLSLTHQLHREAQACVMKHSNSYPWDRCGHQVSLRTSAAIRCLWGPLLSLTRRVRERRKIELAAHFPQRDSNLYHWDTRPSCFRLHNESRHASHQFEQTLQALTHQLHRGTQTCITKHPNSVCEWLSVRASVCASVRACVCVCVCVCVCACVHANMCMCDHLWRKKKRKMKAEAMGRLDFCLWEISPEYLTRKSTLSYSLFSLPEIGVGHQCLCKKIKSLSKFRL